MEIMLEYIDFIKGKSFFNDNIINISNDIDLDEHEVVEVKDNKRNGKRRRRKRGRSLTDDVVKDNNDKSNRIERSSSSNTNANSSSSSFLSIIGTNFNTKQKHNFSASDNKAKKLAIAQPSLHFSPPTHKLNISTHSEEEQLNTIEYSVHWTIEDDQQLIRLFKVKGPKWAQISKIINKNRCSIKCRFHSIIRNAIKEWTSEEEIILGIAARMFDSDWKLVNNIFPTRTKSSLRDHYESIIRQDILESDLPLGSPGQIIQRMRVNQVSKTEIDESILDLRSLKSRNNEAATYIINPIETLRNFLNDNTDITHKLSSEDIKKLEELLNLPSFSAMTIKQTSTKDSALDNEIIDYLLTI